MNNNINYGKNITFLMKSSFLVVLILITSSTFAKQKIKVDFSWMSSNKCNIATPIIKLSNIPSASVILAIDLVDLDDEDLDFGGSYIKNKKGFKKQFKIKVVQKIFDKPCPPILMIPGHNYEITVIAKDKNYELIGKGSAKKIYSKDKMLDPRFTSLFYVALKLMNKEKNTIKYPKIYPTTVEYLESLMCKKLEYCPVKAVYFNDTIYYLENLNINDQNTKSIIVHEFIHHIQHQIGFISENCDIWQRNEEEAYRLQAKYLRNNNQDDGIVNQTLQIIKCPQ